MLSHSRAGGLHRLAWRSTFALVLSALLPGTTLAAPTPDALSKRVLLISTGSRLSPGFSVVDQQILQALRAIPSMRVDTYAENLDIVRFPDERSQRIFREYLAARYAEQPPDVVVLIFVGSLGATANVLSEVFPHTPILVAGLTEEDIRPDQLGNLVTGFVEHADARASIDLILRLQPGLRRIVVVGGSAREDRLRLQRVRDASGAFASRVAVEFWDNLSMAELRRAVTALPRDTAILYTPMFRDATGQTFVSADVGRWIGQSASVPVYLMVDQSFGTGAVGGMISSVEAFGKRAGEQARRLLTGTPPGSMPFEVRSDGVPTFDWRALQRWNIPEESLPPGSEIRFRSLPVWREYGGYIAAALIIIVLQGATIVALVLERRRSRRLNAERHGTELELRQKARELAHVGRVSVMGELAASLAHELSQPLTAIYANARAALRFQEQGESAESREALEDLLKDQTRAAEVLRHMRRFVRKETATEFSEVDLGDVIREVVALIRIDAASHGAEIDCDVDQRLPAIRGDRVQVQQVLLNLLLNALDAMSDSPRRRVVSITARSGEGVNVIDVADSGHGIPVDQVERVFEPFYTTKPQGLGVGLSICRAIIRAHGGTLSAVNNELGGATFSFTLPVAKA